MLDFKIGSIEGICDILILQWCLEAVSKVITEIHISARKNCERLISGHTIKLLVKIQFDEIGFGCGVLKIVVVKVGRFNSHKILNTVNVGYDIIRFDNSILVIFTKNDNGLKVKIGGKELFTRVLPDKILRTIK